MTVPDSRPIHDVIAEAVAAALPETLQPVGAGLRFPDWIGSSLAGQLTAYGKQIVDAVTPAVVAACQQATVAQQAELTNAEVERRAQAIYEGIYLADERIESRLVGPWREDPS